MKVKEKEPAKTETRRCSPRLAKLQEKQKEEEEKKSQKIAKSATKPKETQEKKQEKVNARKPSPRPSKVKSSPAKESKVVKEKYDEKEEYDEEKEQNKPNVTARIACAKSNKFVVDEEVKKELTLRECLETLNDTVHSIPLPGREKEICEIQEFIDACLSESKWRVLLISGSPGTGKTATVKHCIQMSVRPYDVSFVNCKTSTVTLLTDDESNWRKLLVIDEIESLPNFSEVLLNCKNHGCSIIGISNAHDRTLAQASSGTSDTKTMLFECYTTAELQNIMWQRVGGETPAIQKKAIAYIAESIGKYRGDAREMLSCLNHVICDALQSGLEQLDLKTTVRFFQQQKHAAEKTNTGIEELGLIDQLALVAVAKGGKKWKDVFYKYSRMRHMEINSTPDVVFDRLVCYGCISDNKKNPTCRIELARLKEQLDSSISVLL